jgi:hypothetical protein
MLLSLLDFHPPGKPLTQGSVAPNALLSAKGINYAPTRRTDK